MTDRQSRVAALKALETKVVGGDDSWSSHQIKKALGGHYSPLIIRIQNGSVDRAKALHEAVVPEWSLEIIIDHKTHVNLRHFGRIVSALHDDEAVARLIAIIRALIVIEESK